TDGSAATRIKNGTASWVYGEELSQRTAMWWSPDGSKLAYYRFDESKVPDFYITPDLTHIQDTIDVEAYPKPGVPNPLVDIFVYDVATKRTTHLDVRDGKPLTNDVVGYYDFHVDWSPDGKELTFLRTNRRQNVLELAACAPDTGHCRTVLREEWPTGWIDDDPAPTMEWLADGNRFIWESGRTGFNNYYLYDFHGARLDTPPVTRLVDAASGKTIADLASTDMSRFDALGLKKIELYTYRTADGQATLHGSIAFPSNFDPNKKYPVLVSVYGGPGVANGVTERFAVPSTLTEFGFIVVGVEARTNPGMGRKALDAVYLKLGQTEIDDMADGIKALW